jgi:hypothetical protein
MIVFRRHPGEAKDYRILWWLHGFTGAATTHPYIRRSRELNKKNSGPNAIMMN